MRLYCLDKVRVCGAERAALGCLAVSRNLPPPRQDFNSRKYSRVKEFRPCFRGNCKNICTAGIIEGTSKSRQRSQTARYFLWMLFYFYSKAALAVLFNFPIKIIVGTLGYELIKDLASPGTHVWPFVCSLTVITSICFRQPPLRRSLAQDWCSVIHQPLKPGIKKKLRRSLSPIHFIPADWQLKFRFILFISSVMWYFPPSFSAFPATFHFETRVTLTTSLINKKILKYVVFLGKNTVYWGVANFIF